MKKILSFLLVFIWLAFGLPVEASRVFNGSSDFGVTATAPVTAVPLTICAWFNASSLAADSYLVSVTPTSVSDNSGWQLFLRSTGAIRARSCNTSLACASSTTAGTVSTGSWHQACAVYVSSTSRTGYLDGVAATTDTTSVTPIGTVTAASIGAESFNGSNFNFFAGKLADVTIWNVALTQAEITSLSKGFIGPMVRPSSIVFWSPLFGRTSPEQEIWAGRNVTWTGTTVSDNPPLFFVY